MTSADKEHLRKKKILLFASYLTEYFLIILFLTTTTLLRRAISLQRWACKGVERGGRAVLEFLNNLWGLGTEQE
jgi:hypothetical protein